MAELNIGKHCYIADCQQLDFLPFTCDQCQLVFCKLHKFYDAHQCLKSEPAHQIYSGQKSFACTLEGCEQRELTAVNCQWCQKVFCLKHRHQIDHACSKYQAPAEKMTNTKEHVEKILAEKAVASSSRTSKKIMSKKARSTAAKVGLMKMKMKAVGDKGIPESERVFFSIALPQGAKEKDRALFFSSQWTVGRIVDVIASRASLVNKNNVDKCDRLCMFDCIKGEKLAPDRRICDVIAEEDSCVMNGCSLIVEYVDPHVNELHNLPIYT